MTSTHTTARSTAAVIAALAAVSTVSVGAAQAAPTGKVVVQTQKMSGPTLKSTQTGWYPAGTTLSLVC